MTGWTDFAIDLGGGRSISGSWAAGAEHVTVRAGTGNKTTRLDGSDPTELARALLTELYAVGQVPVHNPAVTVATNSAAPPPATEPRLELEVRTDADGRIVMSFGGGRAVALGPAEATAFAERLLAAAGQTVRVPPPTARNMPPRRAIR